MQVLIKLRTPSLFRSLIRHFVLDDFSALHHEFDSLKLGDVGQRVARNRDQVGVFSLSMDPIWFCHPSASALITVAA